MIGDRRVIAVIPARGGSKGLPGKNIRPLCGKPLIGWSVEQGLRSTHVDVVAVSTDDPEIADAARQHGAAVPFLRPAELATDTASTYDVIRHLLRHYEKVEGQRFDYVLLLEPTSPLREPDDVDRMIAALDARSGDFDSSVSVGEIREHPSIVKRVTPDGVEPYCPELSTAARRQDNEPAYFPFGVGYLAKTDVLLRDNTFYTRRCLPYVIKRYQNYEIDDIYDFLCIESVMRHEWGLR